MNKTETKRYESIKKFLLPLQELMENPEIQVKFDDEGNFIALEFDDEEGTIAFHDSSGNIYGVYEAWDCDDMSITELKQELRIRITALKEITW